MRFADELIPQGPKAMREGLLLGRALLGHDPMVIEKRILLKEAREAAGIPDRGVTIHVVFRRAGQTTSEMYISVSATGGGHYHGRNRPLESDIKELVVEEDLTPARDRFLRLHQHLAEQLREARTIEAMGGPRLRPVALRRWEFINNAVDAIRYDPPTSSNPLLAAMSQDLKPLLFAWPPAPDRVLEEARKLEQLTITTRRDGKLNGYATTALLLAARVPLAISAAVEPEHHDPRLMQYFAFASLELGVSAWQAIYGPAHKALREGYQGVVIKTAQDLLLTAEQYKDTARAGPADREYFSEQLFLAAPYAFAATQLFQFVIEQDPHPKEDVHQYADRSEELFARLQDGLTHQWLDFDDAYLQQERRKILEAEQRCDTLTAQLLLREGEDSLLRPRAVRGLLLGQVPWPKFKEGPGA